MTDVAAWPRRLGLGRYEAAFRDSDIGADVLPELTADDLQEIGVASVGDRRRLLAAVAAPRGARLSTASAGGPPPPATPTGHAGTDGQNAERRLLTVLFCDLAGPTAFCRMRCSRTPWKCRRAAIAAQQKSRAAAPRPQKRITPTAPRRADSGAGS